MTILGLTLLQWLGIIAGAVIALYILFRKPKEEKKDDTADDDKNKKKEQKYESPEAGLKWRTLALVVILLIMAIFGNWIWIWLFPSQQENTQPIQVAVAPVKAYIYKLVNTPEYPLDTSWVKLPTPTCDSAYLRSLDAPIEVVNPRNGKTAMLEPGKEGTIALGVSDSLLYRVKAEKQAYSRLRMEIYTKVPAQ